MRSEILQRVAEFLRAHRRQKRWQRIVTCLAAVVVFCTTYALILPAITMEDTAYCGLEAHEHGQDCFEKRLICKIPEKGHVHTEDCRKEKKVLSCGLEESQGHTHTEECIKREKALACENTDPEHQHTGECYTEKETYQCGRKEGQGHTHTDQCYKTEEVLACGLEEKAHTHTDACYEKALVCEKKEHGHTLACFSDPDADVESQEDWEKSVADVELTGNWAEDVVAIAKSQLGYNESSRNYVVDEDGTTKKGYTRYGAWYGNAYGDWCAMFVSFCLDYAKVEGVPLEASCTAWIEQLQKKECALYRSKTEYTPKTGDLVFFDPDGDRQSNYVGLAAELTKDSQGALKEIKTIEGNVGGQVRYVTYSMEDERILGYAELPENPDLPERTDLAKQDGNEPDSEKMTESEGMTEPARPTTELSYQGEDYTVRVNYTEEAHLPENVELSVRELTGGEYEESCAQAKEAMGVDKLSFARFFDVSFMADGKELEPSAPVDVKIIYDKPVEIQEDELKSAVHFTENGTEVLDTRLDQESGVTTFSFTQNSFSVVGTAAGYAATRVAVPTSHIAVQEDTPIAGEWYILYAVTPAGSSATAPGYAISAKNPAEAIPLKRAGEDRTTEEWDASIANEDILWKFDGNGFVNASEQYLTIAHRNVMAHPWGCWTEIGLSNSYSDAVKYDYLYHLLWARGTLQEYVRYVDFSFSDASPMIKSFHELGGKREPNPRHYVARVKVNSGDSGSGGSTSSDTSHPMGAITGTPGSEGLEFYNINASGAEPEPLKDVGYTIYKYDESKTGNKGDFVCNMRSLDSYEVPVVEELIDGTYIIEQTSVPDGYIVYPQTKEFTVQNGKATIGVFYDYKSNPDTSVAGKTAQVVDYINRVYQIDLAAMSGRYKYELGDSNFPLVVDQSNSMLFPADLTDTGITVTLYKTPEWNDRNNKALEDAHLDKNRVYYIITDEQQTSTVWAIWYDESDETKKGWCYQDASYYAKAQFYHELGLTQNVIDQGSYVAFVQPGDEYGAGKHASASGKPEYPATNGGGFDKTLGSQLGKETANGKPYTIYTGSKYNRLHELQEGVSILANLLGSLNAQTTMQLVTFCKTVNEVVDVPLDNNGIQRMIEEVNKISTSGGTRQDLALDYVKNNNLESGKRNYVILITDGAPSGATTGDVAKSATALMSANNVTLVTIGLSMENVEGGSQMLKDIASEGGNGENGKWSYKAKKTGDLSDIMMKDIFTAITTRSYEAATSVIQDTVSDSFYLVNPDAPNEPLAEGTWLKLDGHVLENQNPTEEEKKQAGQVFYDPETKSWGVKWTDQVLAYKGQKVKVWENSLVDKEISREIAQPKLGDIIGKRSDGTYYIWSAGNSDSEKIGSVVKFSFQKGLWVQEGYGYTRVDTIPVYRIQTERVPEGPLVEVEKDVGPWNGRLYVKAKEDFIGGNAIDTNKSATIALKDDHSGSLAENPLVLETPTVNVRLLPMNNFEGEATVFLGDTINQDKDGNGIPDVLEDLLSRVEFEKLINSKDGDKPVYNKNGATEAAGCKEKNFTVPYAINGIENTGNMLMPDQWEKLKNGEPVTFSYTYDDASSHGPVGYFTLKLEKDTSKPCQEYGEHASDHVGKDVFAYTLKVTYTAYKLSEGPDDPEIAKRPTGTVHNGSKGPGYEVDPQKSGGLEDGKGVVEATISYKVSVVDGKITVTKKLTEKAEKDAEFTFELFYKGLTGNEAETSCGSGTIKILQNGEMGTETLVFRHLKRGYYVVKETPDSDYALKSVTVVNGKTNSPAYLDEAGTSATFHIGYHLGDDGGEANNIITYDKVTPTGENPKHIVYSAEWQHPNGYDTDDKYHGESYGEASFENTPDVEMKKIPVQKLWDESTGGAKVHESDTVYVALYKEIEPVKESEPVEDSESEKEYEPVKDTEGRAQLLKIDAAAEWKGEFTVAVPKGETLEGYTIREVSGVSKDPVEKWTQAIVINETDENNKVVYYELAAGNHELIKIGKNGYVVAYGGDLTNGLTVTNEKAYELPQSGGPGTTYLYFLGGLLMINAVGNGYRLRRRRERRGN